MSRLSGLKAVYVVPAEAEDLPGVGRVGLDGEERPIPALYAAGELVGGLFYFNYPGGSGLTSGTVFGRIAGEGAGRLAME